MHSSAAIIFVTLYAALILGAISGWVLNIVALISEGAFMGANEVLIRLVGTVVFPLGAVMGWL